MRSVKTLAAAVVGGWLSLGAGQLAPAPTIQHVSVSAGPAGASAPPGGTVTLWVDVTPKPSIHVYAAGAVDFTPVSIVLTPHPSVAPGRPAYPKPDVATAQGSTGNVPAYARPFRITVPVKLSASLKKGETVRLGGAVKYQACDDRLCYPATAAEVGWTLAVR